MNIKFYLKRADRPRTAVEAIIHFDGHRMKVGTGVSIEPVNWNATKQRAKRGYLHEKAVNDRLRTFEVGVMSVYTELVNSGQIITPALLREKCITPPIPTGDDVPPLFTAYDTFLAEEEQGTRLTKGTLTVYRTVKKHLRDFEKSFGLRLSWETLNSLFFQKWTDYLIHKAGLNNVTLWKMLQILRAFLKRMEERGMPVNPDYKKFSKARAIPKGDGSQKTYLSPEELLVLEQLDLSDNRRLCRVRDLFVFMAYTGIRFGDSQRLRPENRKGEFLEIVTGKNRKQIRVPLHPKARRIWDQYEGALPKISSQKGNLYLEEVCIAAEFSESTEVVTYRGTKREVTTVPRYKLIGFHTAKRSAVTNLHNAGVSVEAICQITGNTRDTIERYILPTSDDVTKEVRAAWLDMEGSLPPAKTAIENR